ncbi:hypothetical protein V8F06_013528 [Rhypophila decipiens]
MSVNNKPDQFAGPSTLPSPEEEAALPHNNQATKLNSAIWVLTTLSGGFLALRLYCKYLRRKGLWWDDIILIAAWMTITVECAVLTYMTSLGYGLHVWDFNMVNMPRLLLSVNIAGSFSVTAAIWSKTSFAFTLLRLTEGKTKWFIWFMIVSMNIAMGLSALLPWVTCSPVQKSWDMTIDGTCWKPTVLVHYNIFSAAYSGLMDIALALLPWKVIWKLQMRLKEKVGVALAMSMGIVAGITGLVKTSKITVMLSHDFADGVDLFIWGNAETTTTIIAASIPILRVLIRDVTHSRHYYRHRARYDSGKQSSVTATSSRHTGASVIKPSGNVVVTISGGPPTNSRDTHQVLDDGSEKSMVLNGAVPAQIPGRIVKTKDFSVQYHYSNDRREGTETDEFEMQNIIV